MATQPRKPATARICWDEAEWDHLATLVYSMRKKSTDSLSTLANRAQKQFPKDRQRGVLTTKMLRPLIERIQAMDRDLQARADKSDELRARLAFFEGLPQSREELLDSVTDDELHNFKPRLLQMLAPADVVAAFRPEILLAAIGTPDLIAAAARRFVGDLAKPIHVHVEAPAQAASPRRTTVSQPKTKVNGHKPRIVVIGTKGDQPRHVREGVGTLCDLTFIEADRVSSASSVPRNVAHVIIWSKFVSHQQIHAVHQAVDAGKITEHFGGVTQLVELIRNLCTPELVGV